jgi:hypothetical protein
MALRRCFDTRKRYFVMQMFSYSNWQPSILIPGDKRLAVVARDHMRG